MAAATNAVQEDQPWDEAQCVAALAALERLQDQLDEVRLVIPALVEPLKVPRDTPRELFLDFKQTAIGVSKRMQNFDRTWKAQETQSILAYARQRQKADPDLDQGRDVLRYGWLNDAVKENKVQSAPQDNEASKNANNGPADK
ncbi:uncharacterized protein K452DRAFT_295621 [Aplosporella prunicola CBS 121167]|uniref:Uncharacterized protein n=1 Tax=Aplosporella prunicola CBS 121167 TaxID=1176127 RepID=A0A6A6BLZ0_9PEZI|nr:uncharacterized protein K452DRAFT_295621 [Aplosporella prunicola CBS 121167]KAF2145066.1 hypothetical protein K452DRAFT_295621 [Aplosporella prunicola CBS 121167]